MDFAALQSHLDREFHLFAAAIGATDPADRVPTCPDWSAADLENHLAMVYLHKVECMRRNGEPSPWPPANGPGPLAEAYSALRSEFAARRPEEQTYTWFEPDQTVGFWIRRMAHETAIHRVDAELAAGLAVTPIAADLGADGIDEAAGMIRWQVEAWPEDFGDLLDTGRGRGVLIRTEGQGWLFAAAPGHLAVARVAPEVSAAAYVDGEADGIDRWLWNRGGDVVISGDEELVGHMKAIFDAES